MFVMLLIEDWQRRDLNLRVLPVLSLGILVVSPSESLHCMFRDKKMNNLLLTAMHKLQN